MNTPKDIKKWIDDQHDLTLEERERLAGEFEDYFSKRKERIVNEKGEFR